MKGREGERLGRERAEYIERERKRERGREKGRGKEERGVRGRERERSLNDIEITMK